ncbi:MAG: Zn-dependent alcohol dehydrogenase [bacterium]|nr:Zn-dependent alcohol dehydrogenase [bacterium]
MKAAVVYEAKEPIDVVEFTSGSVGPHDVRVRVGASGLCHSDVAVQTGDLPFPLPMILGHEGAGVVEEVGNEVTTCQVGDHVVLSALIHCGVCRNCLKGRPNLCTANLELTFPGTDAADGAPRMADSNGRGLYQFSAIGTLSEELVCNERRAIPIPDDVPMEIAAMTGCGVLTGTSAVFNRAKVQPGSTVVVIGCGGVGLNVIQAAALAGASVIIGVDLHDDKLSMAQGFGATNLVKNESAEATVEQIFELTGGEGADYAFEVVGIPALVSLAWDCLRQDGTVVAIGVQAAGAITELPGLEFCTTEKTLMGCVYGTSRPTTDIPMLVEMYRQGQLEIEKLITHRFDLEEINGAVEKMEDGHNARGVVVF